MAGLRIVGGVSNVTPRRVDDESVMDALARAWASLELMALDLAAIEDKLGRQHGWLSTEIDDGPIYAERWTMHCATKKRRSALLGRIAGTIRDLERCVNDLSATARPKALAALCTVADDGMSAGWALVREHAPFRGTWPLPVRLDMPDCPF